MNIRTILLILSALTLLFLLNACGDLSSQQSVANDALKSLRKLDASLQVGGSYGQYQSFSY